MRPAPAEDYTWLTTVRQPIVNLGATVVPTLYSVIIDATRPRLGVNLPLGRPVGEAAAAQR